jgi:hypothetical protein
MSGQNQIWNVESGVLGNPGLFGILNRNTLQAPFTINPSGNVGIGTTSPAFRLDVKGEDAFGNTTARITSSQQAAILSLDSTIGGQNQIWNVESGILGNPGLFGILNRNTLQARFTIDPAGRVNIPGNLDVGQTLNANALTGNFTIPTSRLTGLLAIGNGGTGLGSVGASGNFLRSDGSAWTSSPIQVSDIPNLSSNFIQNTTTSQPASNFNISGMGTAAVFNAAMHFNIGGQRVLSATGTSGGNTSVGIDAGISISSGTGNSFLGWGAGSQNSGGSFNSFFGAFAGRLNTTGFSNTFVGDGAGEQNINGNENSIFGTSAGRGNTLGSQNSYFGVQAGFLNQIGNNNSFFGYEAGFNNNASDNAIFGSEAGLNNSSGASNAFFGRRAGYSNTSGANNSFFGSRSGFSNNGTRNSFFGDEAGQANTSGSQNTFVGNSAGHFNTLGGHNTFVGDQAGVGNDVGTFNTILGAGANVSTGSLGNATAIGAGAIVSASNSLVLGNNANVGIGTSAPGSKLTVAGLIETTNGGVKFPDGTIQTSAAGAGSITDITAGAGLTGGGATGNLTLDVGAGPGINVAADSISIADAGVTTTKLADASVLASKIAAGQVVKSVTVGTSTLRDNLTLAAGPGIALTPAGNTVTIASTGGGGGLPAPGSPNYIQNTTTTQTSANFHISGNGTLGGTLSASNIGIGTTTPAHRLSIESSGITESSIRSTNERAILSLDSSAAGQRRVWTLESGIFGAPGVFGIYDRTVGLARLVIGQNGNVAIGTTFTGSRLTVDGGGILSLGPVRVFTMGIQGNMHVCRSSLGVMSFCSSSLRYKTDLRPFSDGLKFINQLRPLSFTWKSDASQDVGFGAEDVARINPLFVTYNDKGEVEGVKYDRLSVAFVNAFKEQQAQIAHQQQQIDDLKKLVCQIARDAAICKQ